MEYSLNQAEADNAGRVSIKLNSELANILESETYESLEIAFVSETEIELYTDKSKFILQKKDLGDDIYDICACSGGPLVGDNSSSGHATVKCLGTTKERFVNKAKAIQSTENSPHKEILSLKRGSHKAQRVSVLEAPIAPPVDTNIVSKSRKRTNSSTVEEPSANERRVSKKGTPESAVSLEPSSLVVHSNDDKLPTQRRRQDASHKQTHSPARAHGSTARATCQWLCAAAMSSSGEESTAVGAELTAESILAFFSPIQIRCVYAFPKRRAQSTNTTQPTGSHDSNTDDMRGTENLPVNEMEWFIEFESRQGAELGLLRSGETVEVHAPSSGNTRSNPRADTTQSTSRTPKGTEKTQQASSSSSSSRHNVALSHFLFVLRPLSEYEAAWAKALAIPYSALHCTSLTGLFLPPGSASGGIAGLRALLGSDATWFAECLRVMTELAPELYGNLDMRGAVETFPHAESIIPSAGAIESSLSAQLLSRQASESYHSLGSAPTLGAYVKDAECGSWRHLFRPNTAVKAFLQESSSGYYYCPNRAIDQLGALIHRLLVVQSGSLQESIAAFIVERNTISSRRGNEGSSLTDSQAMFEAAISFSLLDQIGRLLSVLCAVYLSNKGQ